MMSFDKLNDLLQAFEERVRRDLRLRCEEYAPDFEMPEVFNVLTALLARQATLGIEVSSAPQLWNPHSAPLFLRAMADVHIALAWILLDGKTRVRQYLEHGLGQAVLQLEHLKKEMASADDLDQSYWKDTIESEQSWIDVQKWNFLVEVNVGAWSGRTTREMAEQAGLLDFYNHVYTPFSQCAHSTWYHIGRYNSAPSESPYTRLLWIPRIADSDIDPSILILAAKYLDKSFNAFDVSALGRSASSEIEKWVDEQLTANADNSDNAQEGG
jgi:hypothetical protein